MKRKSEKAIQRSKKVKKEKPNFTWAGALKDYRDEFTSLKLQKKALEWREDEERT